MDVIVSQGERGWQPHRLLGTSNAVGKRPIILAVRRLCMEREPEATAMRALLLEMFFELVATLRQYIRPERAIPGIEVEAGQENLFYRSEFSGVNLKDCLLTLD